MEALSFQAIRQQGKSLDFAITLQRTFLCAAAWGTPQFADLDDRESRQDFAATVRDKRLTLFVRGCAQALIASGVAVHDSILSATAIEFPALDMGKPLLEAERMRLAKVCAEVLSPMVDRLEVEEWQSGDEPVVSDQPKLTREQKIDLAIGIKSREPNRKNYSIADELGFDPSILSKDERYLQVCEALEVTGKASSARIKKPARRMKKPS